MALKTNLRVAVSLIVVTLSTVALSRESAAKESLAGSYKYVGGEAEVNALFAAVESVVQKMSVFSRGIARGRLRKPNMPSAELDLTVDAQQITVARTGQKSVAAPPNGTAVKWNGPDGKFTVSYALNGNTLLQTMDGKNSHSTNLFALDKDGETLHVKTKIVSKRLPAPVTFDMTYRKH